jgi:hypothetical protein
VSLLLAVLLAAQELILPAGTPVPLTTRQEVNSRTAIQGDRIALQVAEEVRVNGRLVIPRGAAAVAEVARERDSGAFGRAGKLEIVLLQVMIGDQPVRLSGRASEKGRSATLPALSTGIVVSAALGAVIRGKHAVLPAGSRLTGYIHRDVPLVPRP